MKVNFTLVTAKKKDFSQHKGGKSFYDDLPDRKTVTVAQFHFDYIIKSIKLLANRKERKNNEKLTEMKNS